MSTLRERMAQHGFESNDEYDYPLRCLVSGSFEGIKALNVTGDCGRRKTAFASALAQALEYPHVLYHDFSQQNPPQPDIILPPTQDELGRSEPPIDPLDQVVSEACAFSEGEGTILLLDQLQVADFREHIRIYKFLTRGRWSFRDAIYYANRQNLLVFLISETGLYHSLQKHSFRIWVERPSSRQIPFRPQELGLGEDAAPLLGALARLFERLHTGPTRSEYAHLLEDIHRDIRTADALRHSIYGWTEGVDRDLLYSAQAQPAVETAVQAIRDYVGMDEVELVAHHSARLAPGA
jgi:hypothetical protein